MTHPTNTQNTESLILENQRLKALVDSFHDLNGSIDLETVLHKALERATTLMQAEIGSIALIDESGKYLDFVESTDKNFDRLKNFRVPIGKGIAGSVAQSGKSERVDDVHKDDRFYGKIDEVMQQKTVSYICTPLIVDDKVIGTAQLMNRHDGGTFSQDDEDLLAGFAHLAAMAIHNAQMHLLQMKQKAYESEMTICADIQQALFPVETPNIKQYELLGFSIPAREVGGDYYGFIKRDDGSYDIVVADISGKGVSAALMVSEFHTGYQLLAQEDLSLSDVFNRLNAHLMDSLPVGHFITAFAMRVNPDISDIQYVLAGHNPPMLIHHEACIELERTGMFLGIDNIYKQSSFQMEKGDLLAAFSDGFPEARDVDMNLFSEDRMQNLFIKQREEPLEQIKDQLLAAVDSFRGNEPLPDDTTLVLMRRP